MRSGIWSKLSMCSRPLWKGDSTAISEYKCSRMVQMVSMGQKSYFSAEKATFQCTHHLWKFRSSTGQRIRQHILYSTSSRLAGMTSGGKGCVCTKVSPCFPHMFLPPARVRGKFLINKDDSFTKQQKIIFSNNAFMFLYCETDWPQNCQEMW